MELHGWLCTTPVYQYRGWLFEHRAHVGPWPLKKDGELRKRAGKQFWAVFAAWLELSEDAQKQTRVSGGCMRF